MSRESNPFRGTVLAIRNVGDSDRVVDLLTDEYGRVDAWARGARRSKKRFAGALDRLQSLEGRLLLQGERYSLQEARCPRPRLRFRSSLAAMDEANTLLQFTRHGVPHGPEAAELHPGFRAALDALEEGSWEGAARYYVELLVWSGSAPDVQQCARCEVPLVARAFLAKPGELICETCAKSEGTSARLRSASLALLGVSLGPIDRLVGSEVPWTDVAADLAGLLRKVHQGLSGQSLPALSRFAQVDA